MGTFSRTPQLILEESYNKVCKSIDKLAEILDSNEWRLNEQSNREIRILDSLFLDFFQLCNIHNGTVKAIKVEGTPQILFMVVTMSNAMIRDISAKTGYVFECTRKI